MRTERQKQAARANGAKSRGPLTSEGKLASSRNAVTHGILSGTIVLKGESEERFHALLADLLTELQPQTTVETTLVENMAVARWRQMRIWGIEKANMEHQMRADALSEDNATRCALAFRTLSDDSRSLELINRYESRYDRHALTAAFWNWSTAALRLLSCLLIMSRTPQRQLNLLPSSFLAIFAPLRETILNFGRYRSHISRTYISNEINKSIPISKNPRHIACNM